MELYRRQHYSGRAPSGQDWSSGFQRRLSDSHWGIRGRNDQPVSKAEMDRSDCPSAAYLNAQIHVIHSEGSVDSAQCLAAGRCSLPGPPTTLAERVVPALGATTGTLTGSDRKLLQSRDSISRQGIASRRVWHQPQRKQAAV